MSQLKEVIQLFSKLGVAAFGGPAAHIAMMEDEVVGKRKWMSRQHFLDMVGATNLIPGPNSTEMAMHCGYHRAGLKGLVAAGLSFILPAVCITAVFAFIYVKYGHIPALEPLFAGIRPAVLAIIFQAVFRLGKKAVKGVDLAVIGCMVLAASLAGISEVIAILGGGLFGMLWLRIKRGDKVNMNAMIIPAVLKQTFVSLPLAQIQSMTFPSVSLNQVFLVFLKVGSVLFGSGYVLIAYLEGELVTARGWITQQQLLDAIAIGQFTPGPVLSTSTFIGYLLSGFSGAAMATIGIFLPSFVFVAILNPLIPKMRRSKWLSAFLDAVNVSAVGIMAAVILEFLSNMKNDIGALIIAALSVAFILTFKKASVLWVVVGGIVMGYVFHMINIL